MQRSLGLGEAPLRSTLKEENMELAYIRIDDRIDAVHTAELRASETAQREFRERYLMSWVYHELGLEGVVLSASDIQRAFSGSEGRDYCDGESLKRVRRYRDAVRRLQLASSKRESITRGTLLEYQAILCGHQPRNAIRHDEGATQQYKHDVVDPSEIEEALRLIVATIERDRFLQHPIQLAIETHYKIIKLWPFVEHSAAVARLVSNQILYTNGYPPALIHAEDRQQYYHCLHYDIRRLQSLVMDALSGQISMRERLFLNPRATHETRLAS
ncbi:MAG: Fic family protein [Bradymonadia bacterium]|jgi:Fic family protein